MGDNMIRKTVAAILLAGMTLSACACTATECYLHIMVQKDDGTLYDTTKESVMGWILKEFKLNSGRRALSYATSEDNIFNILIESDGKFIKVRVGTADKWPYSVEQLANAIDSGFVTET